MGILIPALAAALAQQGRLDLAIPHLEQEVEHKPDLADAQNHLGAALAMTGRWADAVPRPEAADKLAGGKEPMILDLLGQAYAKVGRNAEAAATAPKR